MKKQIFILVFAAIAISINSVFGQKATPGSIPAITAGCTDDALHPIAGKKYNYAAAIGGGATGNYTWWVTKDVNFIPSIGMNNIATRLAVGPTAAISAASAAYGVAGTTGNVDITWSSTVLANTSYQGVTPAAKTATFVVVQVDGTLPTCSNNLKVYEINPRNGFTVDIKNLNNVSYLPVLKYGDAESQCIDKVSKATYFAGTMQYEYGTNIFYYEVVAAHFSQEWTPSFTVTKADAVQTYTLEWTYAKPSTWAVAPTWHVSTDKVETDETDTSNGVSIYVRLTVVNHNFEGTLLASNDIVVELDGVNKDGAFDIKNSTCVDPAGADKDDKAIQTLKPRPIITPGTSSLTAPTTIISGNEAN